MISKNDSIKKMTSSLKGFTQNSFIVVSMLAIGLSIAPLGVVTAFAELQEDKTTAFFESVGSEMLAFAPMNATTINIVVTGSPDLHEDETSMFFTVNGYDTVIYEPVTVENQRLIEIVVVAEVVL